MEIIDAQVHLNRLGPHWETTPLSTVVDYAVSTMDAIGLDAVFIDEWVGFDEKRRHLPGRVLPNGAMRGENPFSDLAVQRYPDRFAYIARIDPNDPEIESLMAGVRQRPGAVALRIVPIPDAGEVELFERGGYDALFASAEKHGIPIFCWFPGRSHLLVPALEKFPKLSLILDHCGVPRDASGGDPLAIAELAKVLELARFPNLALKWCHAPTHLSREAYPFADVMPLLRRALDAFGPARVMWASDHTQSKVHHSWAQALYYLLDSPDLSLDEKAWLLGRSVRTLMNWPLPV